MNNKSLSIIFAGTPDFAVPSLKALINSHHEVIAVYTQPDRPAGRGRKLVFSPVKDVALAENIHVLQPESLRDPEQQKVLAELNADMMVVAAYGLLLPEAVLQAPKYGCINVHASLLPRFRGAAPIQRAIIAGDQQTGVTIMQMDKGLDTGDMLYKLNCPIHDDDTGQSLHDRLAALGPRALMPVLEQLTMGTLKPEQQDNDLATYANKLEKEEGRIAWQEPAELIARKIRAFNPWPVSYCKVADERVRIWQAQVINQQAHGQPGQVINIDREGIDIATGTGVLRILQCQLPGGKVLSCGELLNGKPDYFTMDMVLS